MPRRVWLAVAGIPRQIIQRGNNGPACLAAAADYRCYPQHNTRGRIHFVPGWLFLPGPFFPSQTDGKWPFCLPSDPVIAGGQV